MAHIDTVQAKLDEIAAAGRDIPPVVAELVLALAGSIDGAAPAAPAKTSKTAKTADPAVEPDAAAVAATAAPADAPAQPE